MSGGLSVGPAIEPLAAAAAGPGEVRRVSTHPAPARQARRRMRSPRGGPELVLKGSRIEAAGRKGPAATVLGGTVRRTTLRWHRPSPTPL